MYNSGFALSFSFMFALTASFTPYSRAPTNNHSASALLSAKKLFKQLLKAQFQLTRNFKSNFSSAGTILTPLELLILTERFFRLVSLFLWKNLQPFITAQNRTAG